MEEAKDGLTRTILLVMTTTTCTLFNTILTKTLLPAPVTASCELLLMCG